MEKQNRIRFILVVCRFCNKYKVHGAYRHARPDEVAAMKRLEGEYELKHETCPTCKDIY
jgi:hypothetical protein